MRRKSIASEMANLTLCVLPEDPIEHVGITTKEQAIANNEQKATAFDKTDGTPLLWDYFT